MRRRKFLILGGALVAWPFAGRAQETDAVARVGVLGPSLDLTLAGRGYQILSTELQKLGFSQGKNLDMQYRRTDQGLDAAIAGVRQLIAAKTDVLVATGSEISLRAAIAPNSGRPIVMMAFNYDPIARGYVKGLSHPGGNITGLFFRQPELAPKQLQLLAEAFPAKTQLGILWDAQSADQFDPAEQEARKMGMSVVSVKLDAPPYNFEEAFRTLVKSKAQLLLVLSSPLFAPHGKQIAELAIRYRLPAMYIFKSYVEAGGLMSYGVDTEPLYRRCASYVAKILRGAKPSDLPVEQADNFEFALNLKTAKAADFTLPTSILLRADEVIE